MARVTTADREVSSRSPQDQVHANRRRDIPRRSWYPARAMAARPTPPVPEPDDGVDVTLIRWMLSLSPEERLAVLQGFADSVAELTHDSPATEVQRSRKWLSTPER